MSGVYSPAEGAIPSPADSLAFLNQRDLSILLPINYIINPAVSLSSACFGNLAVDETRLAQCFSNLLAAGFRRFELDLYWDGYRNVWSFCPVAIPPSGASDASAPPPPSLQSSTTSAQISQTSTSGPVEGISLSSGNGGLAESVTFSESVEATESASPSSAGPQSRSLPSMGQYSCSSGAILEAFSSQLSSYIIKTHNTLDAQISYYIFNIHAAASPSSPASPAPSPTKLPSPEDLIGSFLYSNLSSYIYSPMNLASNRANLNSSWFYVPERYRPVTDYYSMSADVNQVLSTEDGWPSEAFLEFTNAKRILLQFGTIDPQMQGVDYSSDSDILFPSGYTMQNQTNLSINSTGGISAGCYLHDPPATVANTNSSWATFPISQPPPTNASASASASDLAASLTSCGISPLLNTTLSNATADTNPTPYLQLAHSTLWSWAPTEPRNFSLAPNSSSAALMRCATTSPSGRWSVADCTKKYFLACRAAPFAWSISTYPVTIGFAPRACPPGAAFAAPASALENAYLTAALRATRRDYDDPGDPVLVAFNSVDVAGCWVVGDATMTCPYDSTTLLEFTRRREIVVPTVAAIIVLAVSALTLFSKLAVNRKVRKRTRRRLGSGNGYVFEGVPS